MPKRNLERIRDLLLLAEAVEYDGSEDFESGYVDVSDDMVPGDGYQLTLMSDAGCIAGKGVDYGLFRMTNLGHEYLDAVKNEGVWQKTRDVVAAEGGNVALVLVKSLALAFGKKQLEERTGLKL